VPHDELEPPHVEEPAQRPRLGSVIARDHEADSRQGG
jgi:hypothetical protein